jgi:hypothetical protein
METVLCHAKRLFSGHQCLLYTTVAEVIVGTAIRGWTTETGTNQTSDGHIDVWTQAKPSSTTKTNQLGLESIALALARARLPLEGGRGLDRLPVDQSPGDLDLIRARAHVNLFVALCQEKGTTTRVRRRGGRDLDRLQPALRIQTQGPIANDTRRRNVAHVKKRSGGGKRRKRKR